MKYSHDNDARLKEYYHNDCFKGVREFSLREIKDGEELFMDYLFSKIYDIDKYVPDWLIKPPPMDPYLTKYEYESKFSFIAKLIDNYLFN